MRFDEDTYKALLQAHRKNRSNPEDLMERYAITLPARDEEIKAQVDAVRAYWNKVSAQSAGISQVAKWCRTRDEELRKQHGAALETARWWQEAAAESGRKSLEAISELADSLRQAYGALGVVTAAALGKAGSQLGLSPSQAATAAGQAGLTVIDEKLRLPDAPLTPTVFKDLVREMNDCQAAAIPELLHPGSGKFKIVARYESVADPARRLDLAAIQTQITEAGKSKGQGSTARVGALRKLRDAHEKGVDLRDITLYHLIEMVGDTSPSMAKPLLEKRGVEAKDAAMIAVLLEGRQKAARESGREKVSGLLETGQLREAASLLGTLPEDEEKAAVSQLVAAKQRELEDLLAQAADAKRASNEALAEQHLRAAGRISHEDADRELAQLPLAPPAQPSAAGDGASVKVFWQRGPGHDESTVYAVTRTTGRPPAAPTDGTPVHRGTGAECADPDAPVATEVQYGIFAIAEGRPQSRPVITAVTPLPPVWDLTQDTGIGAVTLHWKARPEADIRVTRAAPGADPVPVPVTGSSVQVRGLPDGIAQRFDVVAVYRSPGGTELRSLVQRVTATPRGEAKPNGTLKVTTTQAAGRIRVRATWHQLDSSEVHILRSAGELAPPFGSMITMAEARRAGELLSGHVEVIGKECALEVELPGGIHYLTPLSEGGTGVAVGKSRSIAIIDPVTNLTATPFTDYATIAWQWPATAQLAEVSWKLRGTDEIEDAVVLSRAEMQSKGGVRVPLGARPRDVEVRTMITANGKSHLSPPASIPVEKVVKVPIRYRVSRGAFGGRGRKVTFTAEEACAGTTVRMIAVPGRVMPTKPNDGVIVLEASLNLERAAPAERKAEIPKSIKRPYWVRCFIMSGPGRLIDPPITDLKED